MANVSDWKGFEKDVAEALGGKRRLRTMESYGKEAPDVYFGHRLRKEFPALRHIAVECKKRRRLDIVKLFAEATVKYGEDGRNRIILASKIPVGRFGKKKKKLEKKLALRYSIGGPVWRGRIRKLKKELKGAPVQKSHIMRVERKLKKGHKKKLKKAIKELRAKMNVTALVTVDLPFFKELFAAWLDTKSVWR